MINKYPQHSPWFSWFLKWHNDFSESWALWYTLCRQGGGAGQHQNCTAQERRAATHDRALKSVNDVGNFNPHNCMKLCFGYLWMPTWLEASSKTLKNTEQRPLENVVGPGTHRQNIISQKLIEAFKVPIACRPAAPMASKSENSDKEEDKAWLLDTFGSVSAEITKMRTHNRLVACSNNSSWRRWLMK